MWHINALIQISKFRSHFLYPDNCRSMDELCVRISCSLMFTHWRGHNLFISCEVWYVRYLYCARVTMHEALTRFLLRWLADCLKKQARSSLAMNKYQYLFRHARTVYIYGSLQVLKKTLSFTVFRITNLIEELVERKSTL